MTFERYAFQRRIMAEKQLSHAEKTAAWLIAEEASDDGVFSMSKMEFCRKHGRCRRRGQDAFWKLEWLGYIIPIERVRERRGSFGYQEHIIYRLSDGSARVKWEERQRIAA